MRKKITILGSTGSVGLNALAVVRENPARFEIAGLAAGTNAEALAAQVREFAPEAAYLGAAAQASAVAAAGPKTRLFTGSELRAFAASHDFDVLVAASSGTSALMPVIDALERGKRVALANKELLVVAGSLVTAAARAGGGIILPVDSEHSAIFQCLEGNRHQDVERLILTGSGGPLREVAAERFSGISKEKVLDHPKWRMGKKITVDSATLMNKGLEIIEASWLFRMPVERIEVLIHPEAVVHSMVEYSDGAVMAQLGAADMKLPLRYALGYPERPPCPKEGRLDFRGIGSLTFAEPDRKKFPCLDLAYGAAKASGSAPCVLSAADEVAVSAFLEDAIDFTEIPRVIEKVLTSHRHVAEPGLSEIESIHAWAVEETKRLCRR